MQTPYVLSHRPCLTASAVPRACCIHLIIYWEGFARDLENLGKNNYNNFTSQYKFAFLKKYGLPIYKFSEKKSGSNKTHISSNKKILKIITVK